MHRFRQKYWVALLILGISLFALTPSAGEYQKKERVRRIPLESIYSTNLQKGLKPIDRSYFEGPDGQKMYVKSYGKTLDAMIRDWRLGTSNVFLVRGDDITAAIKATSLVYRAGRPGHLCPGPEDGKKHTQIWAVVYFGGGPTIPGLWTIRSVEQRRTELQVNYAIQAVQRAPRDIRLYFAWIPLGRLEAGNACNVKLFDVNGRQVTLMRRVEIRAK